PIGAVFFDHPIALRSGWELAAPRHAGATTEILESDRGAKLHRFHIVAAAVAVNKALRRHNLFESDLVLIIAAVGAVPDKAPNAARAEIETESSRGEAEWSPPLRQMLWISPGGEHQRTRRVEFARADDRSRIAIKIDAACCDDLFCSSRLAGHYYAPQWASGH